ncbi:DNA adenine methylase [Anaerospora hongkongensis]|uniref:DNA adenine methylase n=1 Tax=Anaerospora hongkongensis TaxID=244830 RepID=UPI00289E2569|nr:DNA adenine methylase [Anaerospora hongkongensis]
MKTILRYPGAKWNMTDWILQYLPPHEVYLEPYFGSGAVFFNKVPSGTETINDIDGHVVNLFRVLRDRPLELARKIEFTPWSRDEYMEILGPAGTPVILSGDSLEDARRFLIRCHQSHGCRTSDRGGWAHDTSGTVLKPRLWNQMPERIMDIATRLKDAQIENRPAIELIKAYRAKKVAIYADPPYPLSTRKGRMYHCEMTDDDHIELLEALDNHPGPVLLSGYDCELYNSRLGHWNKKTRPAKAEKGQMRTEVLWVNPIAARSIGQLFA